jgi:hypothetical protein
VRISTIIREVTDVECETFFTFSHFALEAGLTMIVVLHAKTVTIRYPLGAASHYCQGCKGSGCEYDFINEET